MGGTKAKEGRFRRLLTTPKPEGDGTLKKSIPLSDVDVDRLLGG